MCLVLSIVGSMKSLGKKKKDLKRIPSSNGVSELSLGEEARREINVLVIISSAGRVASSPEDILCFLGLPPPH